jgi:hypothetical protein
MRYADRTMRLRGELAERFQQEISAFYLHGTGPDAERPGSRTPALIHERDFGLEALPLRHRLPLLLVEAEGFSHDAAARVLMIPRWVFDARLVHARRALRALKRPRATAAGRRGAERSVRGWREGA